MSKEDQCLEQKYVSFYFNHSWAIFFISLLSLFLEMLLIRWIGTEIRIFAYLQNTILVACFLGLGLGLFTSHQPIRFHLSLLPLAILLLFMSIPMSRKGLGYTSELLSVLDDFVIWGNINTPNFIKMLLYILLGAILTFAILIFIVDIFVPIGRLLGRLMDNYPETIKAYSINVAGSLVGTLLFVVMSLYYQPPITWFLVFGALAILFIIKNNRHRKINIILLISIIILSWFAGLTPNSLEVVWSPYQKLVVIEQEYSLYPFGDFLVSVNNSSYQMITDLSETTTLSNRDLYPQELQGLSQYDIPLLLHPNPQKYLIVGAGAGNDAAGGLRQGVKEITAVEIDPAIINIGKKYHPEKPYSAPNVRVVNDDARSFFATSNDKFDVISFGLLDSHTTTSMTNARLDHYVYTQESITRAKSLLTDNGVMVLTFEAQKDYITDRMAKVLTEVFKEEPIIFRIPGSQYGWGGVMFITGDLTTAKNQIAQNPRLEKHILLWQQNEPIETPLTTKIVTDDWPYLYLKAPKIPILYYLITGLVILVLLRSMKRWKATNLIARWSKSHWHFFFLGAGFLLLEVQNISKASVVLGNTWSVNAIIVSGVLIMALLANLLAHRFPNINIKVAYVGLVGICMLLYFVDLAQFAFFPYLTKAILVGGLTTLPMLFSGLVFIHSFNSIEKKDEALGANLLGALVGALLEVVTFVTGIKALLLIVTALYILSMITLPGLAVKKQRKFQVMEEQS